MPCLTETSNTCFFNVLDFLCEQNGNLLIPNSVFCGQYVDKPGNFSWWNILIAQLARFPQIHSPNDARRGIFLNHLKFIERKPLRKNYRKEGATFVLNFSTWQASFSDFSLQTIFKFRERSKSGL